MLVKCRHGYLKVTCKIPSPTTTYIKLNLCRKWTPRNGKPNCANCWMQNFMEMVLGLLKDNLGQLFIKIVG